MYTITKISKHSQQEVKVY